ncbi:hypothetical protein DSO57_1029253 [Entomophthora muscae]|uniref:Uncharacterized protein n=1 Tax=Entomophthora muscae TaxID=34485 RepID=A0ACC2RS66_9FUNG|nr:hypothetical protein DSO57_1029253 [Entomophthora muscae]
MKEIPSTPFFPNVTPSQDFSKLGFVYITVLGLADQVAPHTESWRPLATAVNYIVRIALIVYMNFQAQPSSPVGVQPDSGMGCNNKSPPRQELTPIPPSEPSPEQIPALSTGSEESYGSITEHRYYNSASYEEPTKKKYSTKNPPRVSLPHMRSIITSPLLHPFTKLPHFSSMELI